MGPRHENSIGYVNAPSLNLINLILSIDLLRFSLSPSASVVEPEPDFLAGAGAGEKALAPGCCYLA